MQESLPKDANLEEKQGSRNRMLHVNPNMIT